MWLGQTPPRASPCHAALSFSGKSTQPGPLECYRNISKGHRIAFGRGQSPRYWACVAAIYIESTGPRPAWGCRSVLFTPRCWLLLVATSIQTALSSLRRRPTRCLEIARRECPRPSLRLSLFCGAGDGVSDRTPGVDALFSRREFAATGAQLETVRQYGSPRSVLPLATPLLPPRWDLPAHFIYTFDIAFHSVIHHVPRL